MRILNIIMSLEYGGAESMLIKLLNEDKQNDNRILLITKKYPLKDKLIYNNKIYSLFGKNLYNVPKAIYILIKILNEFKPEIIQSWMYHSELVGLIIKLFNPKVKLFWNVRNSTKEWLILKLRNRLIFKMLKKGSAKTSGIIVNSKTEIADLIKLGYPENKLFYIPNGFLIYDSIDKTSARKSIIDKFNLPDDAIIIGMVARYHPMKDHENLIRAFAKLKNNKSKAHLVLVGNGFNSLFSNKIESLGLTQNVHFWGTTNNTFIVINGFDIGVLSSYTESFPNVIGEYMLASLPVVATNVSEIKEIVDKNGFIVPIKNSNALCESISKILQLTHTERIKMGNDGRLRIINNYPIEKILEEYLRYYRNSSN